MYWIYMPVKFACIAYTFLKLSIWIVIRNQILDSKTKYKQQQKQSTNISNLTRERDKKPRATTTKKHKTCNTWNNLKEKMIEWMNEWMNNVFFYIFILFLYTLSSLFLAFSFYSFVQSFVRIPSFFFVKGIY